METQQDCGPNLDWGSVGMEIIPGIFKKNYPVQNRVQSVMQHKSESDQEICPQDIMKSSQNAQSRGQYQRLEPVNCRQPPQGITFIKPMQQCSEVTLISQAALLAGESFEILKSRSDHISTKKVTTHYKVFKHYQNESNILHPTLFALNRIYSQLRPEKKEECESVLRSQEYTSIVALEPFILGGCTFKYHETFIELRLGGVAWSHQKMGTGCKILQILSTLACQLGFQRIVTYANSQSVGFFLKQGFQELQKNDLSFEQTANVIFSQTNCTLMYITTSDIIKEDQILNLQPRYIAENENGLPILEQSTHGQDLSKRNLKIPKEVTKIMEDLFPASKFDGEIQKSGLKIEEDIRQPSHQFVGVANALTQQAITDTYLKSLNLGVNILIAPLRKQNVETQLTPPKIQQQRQAFFNRINVEEQLLCVQEQPSDTKQTNINEYSKYKKQDSIWPVLSGEYLKEEGERPRSIRNLLNDKDEIVTLFKSDKHVSQLETTLTYEESDDEGPTIKRSCDGSKSTEQIIMAHIQKKLSNDSKLQEVLSRQEVKEFQNTVFDLFLYHKQDVAKLQDDCFIAKWCKEALISTNVNTLGKIRDQMHSLTNQTKLCTCQPNSCQLRRYIASTFTSRWPK